MTTTLSLYGSFRDSLSSPVHRWFTYPAGFSHKLVEAKIKENNLSGAHWIADPFMGTGTTSLAAREMGVNSLGIEAHPFVYWVAKTKTHLDYDIEKLALSIQEVIDDACRQIERVDWAQLWPPLVYKCFSEDNLRQLAALREAILLRPSCPETDFLRLALTATLRIVTTAGAGWPYIAPSKYQTRTVKRHAFEEFPRRCASMVSDIQYIKGLARTHSTHSLIQGDARAFATYAQPASIDLILTSPPYMNNYDYADRTRLETYFWGIYHTWGDITREVRDRLMMAATTQVRLTSLNGVRKCPGIAAIDKQVHTELLDIIEQLGALRAHRSGKKTYDAVTAGYFEDMLQVIQGAYKVLKPGCQFVLILGDSAPYGVYIPTDEIIGRLALAVGFSGYEIEILRTRGGKWAHNAQRHHVPLRESVLTITK